MDYLSKTGLTLCPQAVTLAATGAATTIDSTGTFSFTIKGVNYSHAAWSSQATPTTDIVTGDNFVRLGTSEGCAFVVGIDSGGTMRVSQGPIVALDPVDAFRTAPAFPPVPDTVCPVGYIIVTAGNTAAAKAAGWLFGTSNFTGVTDVTATFVDIATLPNRPQIA